jgi:GNAT superfamily N-acetyltransferase
VGRIAGIINDRYIENWGQRYGRFGWFDFIDDVDVSRALIESIENWARENRMAAIHGPLGFTDLDPEGMLIEGFEELGTMATLYNHPYYVEHMSRLGFVKDVDWVEYELKTPDRIPEKVARLENVVLRKFGLSVVPARKKDMLPYARRMFELINKAYAGLYGFVGLTDEQIDVYLKQYVPLIHPDYARLIVNDKDELIAFGVAMPSLSRALQYSRGRLLPFGFVHFIMALKFPRNIDLLLVAVTPEFQGKGIPAVLMAEITKSCLKNGIVSAETNVELETNTQVQAMWKHFEARQHKRRRCFIKNL